MAPPLSLRVPEVERAATWYAQALDGEVVSATAERAELRLGSERLIMFLERGSAPPISNTPVRELRVEDVAEWVEAALAAGGTRATPESLAGYAQVRDPFGYLWAFREGK